jgi:uncharacterized SAM-binding protein YcdF (DUF218 family)
MKKWLTLALVSALALLFILICIKEEKKILAATPTSWRLDQNADCAVVLTGGSGRIREGFTLLEQGRVKKLIVSGVNPTSTLYQIFPQLPAYSHVSESDVVLEKRSGTTYGNAVQSEALVEALHCRSVLLVTSTLHMHRAVATFRARFPPEIQIKPHAMVSGSVKPGFFELNIEILKSVFYSLWAY